MPEHPLRGHNDERFGPRFVNMSEPYSKGMNSKAFEVANELNIDLKKGIYLGLQGPTFETLAEYKMVKALGADCVGMSTVPEVIVARHMNMECFGVSVITDMGDEENIEEVNHEEVLEAAKKAEPHVRNLIKHLIAQY
jgi:purine-nucleoside phosphorylase